MHDAIFQAPEEQRLSVGETVLLFGVLALLLDATWATLYQSGHTAAGYLAWLSPVVYVSAGFAAALRARPHCAGYGAGVRAAIGVVAVDTTLGLALVILLGPGRDMVSQLDPLLALLPGSGRLIDAVEVAVVGALAVALQGTFWGLVGALASRLFRQPPGYDYRPQVGYSFPRVVNTSGQGDATVIPPEIQGLNWGGFLLPWTWGIGNSTWIALLALIPGVDLIMRFVLLFEGNEWAWRNRRWESVEHFRRVQRIWMIVGLVLLIVGILLGCLFGVLAPVIGSTGGAQ